MNLVLSIYEVRFVQKCVFNIETTPREGSSDQKALKSNKFCNVNSFKLHKIHPSISSYIIKPLWKRSEHNLPLEA